MARGKLKKVISGGQTGADQGALAAARKLGIKIGGCAPRGYRCEDGTIPQRYAECMCQTATSSYPERTELNVRDSDATIIYCHDLRESPGTKLTINFCKKHRKPWFDMVAETDVFVENEDGFDHMASLLEGYEVINVAGSRESTFPGIFEASKARLIEVFKRLR